MPYQRQLVNQTGRLIAIQVVLVGAGAAAVAWVGHGDWAKGMAYGAGLSALLAAMLSASLQRAAERAGDNGATVLYCGAVERFVAVIAGVVAAATVFQLHIGGVVLGLILAHVVSFIEAARAFGGPGAARRGTE
ncbi:ATP synthase subunit I [Thiohalorhabdus sp.]|uniref:ATP synthase subunit I n=1 Tax=Thiohalorhabdus sp. TaxID=3094134 RepID=UPI002FC37D30